MTDFLNALGGIGLWFLGFLRDLLIVTGIMIIVFVVIEVIKRLKGKDKKNDRK